MNLCRYTRTSLPVLLLLIVCLLGFAGRLHAAPGVHLQQAAASSGDQVSPEVPTNLVPKDTAGINLPTGHNYVTEREERVTLYVLAFGLVCLLAQTALLWRARSSAEEIMRNMSVTLVVTLGICALVVGYDQQQISPIIGLFGTIIGFLLGQRERGTRSPRRGDEERQNLE
jgi:hypothetical protein